MTEIIYKESELKNFIDMHIQYIQDKFGERALQDSLNLAQKAGLDTNYQSNKDIENLEYLLSALILFIYVENRTKHLRVN